MTRDGRASGSGLVAVAAAALAVAATVPGARVLAEDAGVLEAGVAGAGSRRTLADLLADADRPSVTVAISPTAPVSVGDTVTLTITAVARRGDDVAVPEQSLAPFEILDRAVLEGPAADKDRFEFRLTLLALEPGEHDVGPLHLRVVTRGGTIGTMETERVRIVVQSLLANEPNAEPKAATAPVTVMEDDYTLAWIGGSVLVLVLVTLVTWLVARWWARRPKAPKPGPPPRPPWEIALEKLAALAQRREVELREGRAVAWIDGLSDVVREYLGRRFDFDGLESTTDEVFARMRALETVGALRGVGSDEILAFLGDCDLVKFAKATPSTDQCAELLSFGEKLVVATRLAALPPATTGAGASPGGAR